MDLDTAAGLGLLERCVEAQLQLQLLQRHLKTAVSIDWHIYIPELIQNININ